MRCGEPSGRRPAQAAKGRAWPRRREAAAATALEPRTAAGGPQLAAVAAPDHGEEPQGRRLLSDLGQGRLRPQPDQAIAAAGEHPLAIGRCSTGSGRHRVGRVDRQDAPVLGGEAAQALVVGQQRLLAVIGQRQGAGKAAQGSRALMGRRLVGQAPDAGAVVADGTQDGLGHGQHRRGPHPLPFEHPEAPIFVQVPQDQRPLLPANAGQATRRRHRTGDRAATTLEDQEALRRPPAAELPPVRAADHRLAVIADGHGGDPLTAHTLAREHGSVVGIDHEHDAVTMTDDRPPTVAADGRSGDV